MRFKCSSWFFPIIALIVDWRLIKFLYSGFFGLEMFLMNLSEPKKSFFKFMNILNIVYLAAFCPVILLASLLALIFSGWGTQTLISSIEAIILTIVLIVLTSLEWCIGQKMTKQN